MTAPVNQWFRARESEGKPNGVEVKFSRTGEILVRSARGQSNGPTLTLLPQEWEAFEKGIQQGEFVRPSLSPFDKPVPGS